MINMLISAIVGGTPGKDCGGYCKFCYFRSVDYENLDSISLGCKYCPPTQVGCTHCHEVINDIKNGFRPLDHVLSNLENKLKWLSFLGSLNKDMKIVTASWADIIFYPQLIELLSTLKDWQLQVHLGYTSGKGIKDAKTVDKLISNGVNEVNFSVFSMDPHKRRKWMGDKTPEESLKSLKIFCENIEVNASTVVVPGVINEDEIFSMCGTLEDWGIKSFMLSRFVNYKNEGLIFNNRPVIKELNTQPFEEFQVLVKKISDEFSFRVIGAPFYDPEKNTPYVISKRENIKYLKQLAPVTEETTIITSKLSVKPLQKIFQIIARDKVNVIAVEKEIGDLITGEDLATVNLDDVKMKVIIPGGALVHDRVATEILNKDGANRCVVRGPEWLFFYDFELLSESDVIEYELKAFKALINKINSINTF